MRKQSSKKHYFVRSTPRPDYHPSGTLHPMLGGCS